MDRFYRQIISRLNEHLDPQVFEDCAVDLLRDSYPTLVPVRGGGDRGMDGAVADFEGEAFPLVCTTEQDVLRNLAGNLSSHLKKRYPRRKVVLATSRSLTPGARFKLEELAREKGFTLVQIIEQRGIADRLSRSPHWYRKLGLTGTPSALSAVPATRRPLIEIEPVGRDADLEWLRKSSGDRVVAGAPGSGKTFLLYHLVRREQWGLFLVSSDMTAIADAVREEDPMVVFVDDAHADPSRLEQLRRLRDDLGASFSIVATTWEGDRDRVAEALGIPTSQIHKLELLTRDEIVEVIRRAGVQAHDSLMKELVDQAANKPGLAVTLALLSLRGDWLEVRQGRALTRSLMTFFESLGGSDWRDILACLALGGNRGMQMEAVAQFLGLSRQRIRERAVALAAGGVLSEAGDDALAVWPRALRSALLREVFFPGPGPKLDYRELLEKAPSFESAVAAMVDARRDGVDVSPEALRELVGRAGSQRVWEKYSGLGESEALWALSSYPGDWLDLAVPALHLAPSATIPKLLQRSAEWMATDIRRDVARIRRHPLGLIRKWLLNLKTPPEEGIRRRWLLVRTVKEFLQAGGHPETGTNALFLALSPILKGESQDPGSGLKFRDEWGIPSAEERSEIERIWDEMRNFMPEIDASSWRALREILRMWAYPKTFSREELPQDVRHSMRSFATQMMHDLVPLVQGSVGLAAGLRRFAEMMELHLPLQRDPVFELLYPDDHSEERRAEDRRALAEVAEEWATGDPAEVVRRILYYESEGSRIGRGPSGNSTSLYNLLAWRVAAPEIWTSIIIELAGESPVLAPFLKHTVEARREDWEYLVSRCLNIRLYTDLAVSLILEMSEPPSSLLSHALKEAPRFIETINSLCLWKAVPISTLKELLRHSSKEVAVAAAGGEWAAAPRGTVREEVMDDWWAAVISASSFDVAEAASLQYWMGEMLKSSSDLALDWLRRRIDTDDPLDVWSQGESVVLLQALSPLDVQQRMRLLDHLATARDPNWLIVAREMMAAIVRRDVTLYEKLLSLEELRRAHLAPLEGPLDEKWAELALLALEAGHSPHELAEAAFGSSRRHLDLDYWEEWKKSFGTLETHISRQLREVAKHGRTIVDQGLERAEDRRRSDELKGIHVED